MANPRAKVGFIIDPNLPNTPDNVQEVDLDLPGGGDGIVGDSVPFIPNYAAILGDNVINEDNTTWTADQDGFVYVEAGAQSVDAGWLRLNVWINDVRVSKNLSASVLSDGNRIRISDLLPVGKGDVVRVRAWRKDERIENFYVMARFIPPKAVAIPTAEIGIPGGIAPLDGEGKVPLANLPSLGGDVTQQDLTNAIAKEAAARQAAIEEAIATIPPGGLLPPVRIELESQLPNPTTLSVGYFFIVQTMDITAAGKTGKAWINYQDPGDTTSPLVWYKTYDHYYSADGDTIILTPAGQLSVSSAWLNPLLDAKADKVTGATPGRVPVLDANGNLLASGMLPGDPVTISEVIASQDARNGMTLQFTRRQSGLITINPSAFEDRERDMSLNLLVWPVPAVFAPAARDGLYNAVILHSGNTLTNVPFTFVSVGLNWFLRPVDNVFTAGLTRVRGVMLSCAYNAGQ